MKPFGLRIDLAGLERLLSEHEVDAVCTGTDERLVVAVVGECEPDRVATIVSDRVGLPRYVVAVHSMREIPRIPSGKPDYRALLDLAREVEGPQPARSVAGVFASAFEVDVGPEDSFVSLGGDSLSYVEVSVALEELIGELPPDWPDMTVAQLTTVAFVATMLVGVAAWLAATNAVRMIRATVPSGRTPGRPPAPSWTTAASAGRR